MNDQTVERSTGEWFYEIHVTSESGRVWDDRALILLIGPGARGNRDCVWPAVGMPYLRVRNLSVAASVQSRARERSSSVAVRIFELHYPAGEVIPPRTVEHFRANAQGLFVPRQRKRQKSQRPEYRRLSADTEEQVIAMERSFWRWVHAAAVVQREEREFRGPDEVSTLEELLDHCTGLLTEGRFVTIERAKTFEDVKFTETPVPDVVETELPPDVADEVGSNVNDDIPL